MASLYITGYGSVGAQHTQVAMTPRTEMQKLAIGSEVKSAAFNANTRFIRVHCDAICSIVIDGSPTAATTDTRLPADAVEYFGVNPGDKLSVISNT